MIFIRLFDLRLFGFVCFLFLSVSEKGCGLWLSHSLDFSLTPLLKKKKKKKSYSGGLGRNVLFLLLRPAGFSWCSTGSTFCSNIPVVLFNNPGISKWLSTLYLYCPHLFFFIEFIFDVLLSVMIYVWVWKPPQSAFYVNLYRAVIGPSGYLTGRWRPDVDLRRMLAGSPRTEQIYAFTTM